MKLLVSFEMALKAHTRKVFIKKGYHVTEACALTASKHPVSVFSRIHSSAEKDYKSVNTITFDAIKQAAALFGKATFVMDRGYDDNKIFLHPRPSEAELRDPPEIQPQTSLSQQMDKGNRTAESEERKSKSGCFFIREKSIPHIFPT